MRALSAHTSCMRSKYFLGQGLGRQGEHNRAKGMLLAQKECSKLHETPEVSA